MLNRVIGRFPDAPDAYFYRAYANLQAQKPAEAKPDLEKYDPNKVKMPDRKEKQVDTAPPPDDEGAKEPTPKKKKKQKK